MRQFPVFKAFIAVIFSLFNGSVYGLEASRSAAGVPRLNESPYATQDHVITTHDARDYGVIANDDKDDSKALQSAIDACHADGGGVIFIPEGKYVFRNRLIMKSGVYLRGVWRSPELGTAVGTIFSVYYGKAQPDAEPFITMGNTCGLKDIAIWYPEQSFSDPIPYAWTIQQPSEMSPGIENLTLYNSWQGIQSGPRGNQLMTIKNLYMTALHIGFLRDEIYDCQKIQRLRLSPRHWIESGLPGAPETPAEQVALKAFLLKESTGAIIAHYDWTWMYDWLIEGFHTGIEVKRSAVSTDSRGPNGGFIGLVLIDNFISMQIGDVNRCGWSDAAVVIRSSLQGAIGIKVEESLRSVAQFTNIRFEGRFKYCVLSEASYGSVTLAGCTFDGWADDGHAVYAGSGVIGLYQNTFKQAENHLYIGNRVTGAAVLGNIFSGAADIEDDSPDYAQIEIDHSFLDLKMPDLSTFEYPDAIYKPAKSEIFNVRDFGAKGDASTDDTEAFAKALLAAEANGGGTVYVPVGEFILNETLTIPSGVELRGIFDNSHHTVGYKDIGNRRVRYGQDGSELLAYPGKGDADGAPFIGMRTGASLRGVTIVYPEQKWSNYLETGAFTPYPWTIQSQGPEVRLKDVLLVNSYQGADFGTFESTGHQIDYLSGTALKTGLYIDNCFGKGYVKNVQWNGSFWGWSKYECAPGGTDGSLVVRNAVKHTFTPFVYGYSEQQNTLHTFSFGSKVGIHFIKNPEHGGMNGDFLAHGIDHSGTSMVFEDIGARAQFVGFQIVSMDAGHRRFLDIYEGVEGRAEFFGLLGWGHDPCAEIGIEMKSGDFYFLLGSFASFGLEYGIKQTGGTLKMVGFRFNEPVQSEIFGGYTSGLYGHFSEDIEKAELIGTIKRDNLPDPDVFINEADSKASFEHSVYHIGY